MSKRKGDAHTKALPKLDWCSPNNLVEIARKLTGRIDYDPCGNPHSVVGARTTNMLPDGTQLEVGSGKNKDIVTVNYETDMRLLGGVSDRFRFVEYGNGLVKRFPQAKYTLGRELPHTFNNPPYGRQYNRAWAKKNWLEGSELALRPNRTLSNAPSISVHVRHVTCLIAWAPEVQWADYYWDSDAICEIRGRLRYLGAPSSADFNSALVYYGPSAEAWAELFCQVGRVILPRKGLFVPYAGPTIIGGAE